MRIPFFARMGITFLYFFVGSMAAIGTEVKTVWLEDYREARKQAIQSRKMLLVYFYSVNADESQLEFESQTLIDPDIQARCQEFVLLKVPTDGLVKVDGKEVCLLEHNCFRHMRGLPGLAILDYESTDAPFYGYAVSCLPFEPPAYYAPQYHEKESVQILLNLPAGTLTQRTMVYAVRLHPEKPKSTNGSANAILMDATAKHSEHQARIRSQGHHQWSTRFQDIYSQTGGQPPVEVCAESWPGKTLVAACVDCVHSWRQSSGHWNAVRSDQPSFGYDIGRGSNGIWYATGIFGG